MTAEKNVADAHAIYILDDLSVYQYWSLGALNTSRCNAFFVESL